VKRDVAISRQISEDGKDFCLARDEILSQLALVFDPFAFPSEICRCQV
jgi:hypothetical protein